MWRSIRLTNLARHQFSLVSPRNVVEYSTFLWFSNQLGILKGFLMELSQLVACRSRAPADCKLGKKLQGAEKARVNFEA